MFYGFNTTTGEVLWTINTDEIEIPEGVVLIQDDTEYHLADIELGFDDNGKGIVVPRTMSVEELQADVESVRNHLLYEATAAIGKYTDAVEFYPENKAAAENLTAWRKYRAALAVMDITGEVVWPDKPEV